MHGGNIYQLAEELGCPERKIIDFSASINPLGVSKKVKAEIRKHLKYLHNYPDPECKRLIRHIAKRVELPEEALMAGNGSTEFIYLIPLVFNPEVVLIPAPTFSEYERALRLRSRARVEYFKLESNESFRLDTVSFIRASSGKDLVYLCNPNNPTAQELKREEVLQIASACRDTKTFLIVDEAFIDFMPEHSVIKEVLTNPYLIVLRSLTKFYALTGLRIGFIAAHPDVIRRFRNHKEPWTVNNLAQRAAVVALKDSHYRRETFRVIKEEKGFLERELKRLEIKYYPSAVNFYLLEHSESRNIIAEMKKRGILIRDCGNFEGLNSRFMRIAVKGHRENAILIKELKAFFQKIL